MQNNLNRTAIRYKIDIKEACVWQPHAEMIVLFIQGNRLMA